MNDFIQLILLFRIVFLVVGLTQISGNIRHLAEADRQIAVIHQVNRSVIQMVGVSNAVGCSPVPQVPISIIGIGPAFQ
ncbi:hypothetical protein DSECCO2_623450 [anaerobic digester metagenome]